MTSASSCDGVIVSDESGRVAFMDPSAEALTGRTMQFARERPLAEIFQLVDKHTGKAIADPFSRILVAQADTEFSSQNELLRPDGVLIAVAGRAAAMRRSDGSVTGIVVTFRARSASSAPQDERHADMRKDDFFAILAHELRNPLAPIRNALQIMQQVQDDGATTTAARVIIERQLKHLTRLIDDLLDMSRMTQGTFELSKVRTQLSDVIHLAIEIARPQLEGKQHPLQIELGSEAIYLLADVDRLAQAFANLLHNASKYSSAGTRIRVSASVTQDEVNVRVGDQGIGIPADMFERVFEPYGQVDRIEDGTHDGLGIGLTLVKRIIELHGGTARVASAGAGLGSEFTVRLPRENSADLSAAPQPAPRFSSSQRLRILVADDNRDAAHTLAMLLRLDGHEVRSVHDGLEALAIGDGFEPQLVLLDIGMPMLDGYETARQIQERPWGKHAHLVALTGWGLEADRRRAMAAGFHDHLVKPGEPDALKAVIDRISAD
jgi:signal transduction histidine kinase/CheY-like chemotaxis protein